MIRCRRSSLNNKGKDNKMKKILFAIALVITMSFSSFAQVDNYWYDSEVNRIDDDLPWLTTVIVGNVLTDVEANNSPVGSGLLILTALGGGYTLTRKRKH